MSVEPGQSGQRAIFLPRSAFFWRMGASLSPARPVKRRNSRELVRLRVSPLESNMGSHTPSRKPFVIKYGGMAYRGEGDIYHLIDRTGNRARAKGAASRLCGAHDRAKTIPHLFPFAGPPLQVPAKTQTRLEKLFSLHHPW
jgi:hypothetical protein